MRVVAGNLLDAQETYLCHQTNCITRRAAHLALSVFLKFPYADIYTGRGKPDKPGTIRILGDGEDHRFVVNMLGQYYPGQPTSKRLKKRREEYFLSCLEGLSILGGSFAFPWKIGCGAAQGDWERYLDMLLEFDADVSGEVSIYVLPKVSREVLNYSQNRLFMLK